MLTLLATALLANVGRPLYQDPSQPIDKRVDDLVGRMTLEEKVKQMIHDAPAIPRLGVPAYTWWSEALHGVANNGLATSFPQAIGLGATFNTELLREISTVISTEGRAKYNEAQRKGQHGYFQGITFWSPNINIFRDPRWGRGQETYGEDPFLTARLGVEFVKGMQGDDPRYFKTVSTPKHFAVHSGPDPLRHQFNAIADLRDMWLTYLPAFEATVREGGAYSVMSSYNRINGLPASANPFLLQTILREKWGFQGYVVSDCGAISDIYAGHHFVKTAEEAAAVAVKAGCDLACDGTYAALVKAVKQGLIDEKTIDKSMHRLFRARFKLGMFDDQSKVKYSKIPMSEVDSPQHRALALTAARQSMVLLKNTNGYLPLKGVKSIAVIGPNANDANVMLGNYNGTPAHVVTPLEGIQKGAPKGVKVTYSQGCEVLGLSSLKPVPASAVPGGFKAEYFSNEKLEGQPVLTRMESTIDNDWGEGSPAPQVPKDHFSVRWTGRLVAPATGLYHIATTNDDGARLWVDGKIMVDDWSEHGPKTTSADVPMTKGQTYNIRFEYYESAVGAVAKLSWGKPTDHPFDEAVTTANKSDLVVLVLGINQAVESEELDKKDISLPFIQQMLMKKVLATGKPVVLVLVSGSPLSVPDSPQIKGIVQAWYGGQDGGTALADVLYGRYNPSGRLPVTFYKSMAQVPDFSDYKMEGRTYRYLKQKPWFPFGYGLSYTTFAYSGLSVKPHGLGKAAEVEASVTNSGKVAGDEVVQAYLLPDKAKWPTPNKQLVGFKRVHLEPGETKVVSFAIRPRFLATVDKSGVWTSTPASYHVSVGGGQPDWSPATSGKSLFAKFSLVGRQVRLAN